MTLGQEPPHNIETEEAYLGSCLVDRHAVDAGLDIDLKADDFYRNTHRDTWKAILRLVESKKHIDTITVADELEKMGTLPEGVYPGSLLVGFTQKAASYFNAPTYAIVIRDKATRRRLIMAAGDIAGMAYNDNQDIETLMDQADMRLRNIKGRLPMHGKEPTPAEIIDRLEGEQAPGIPTRFPFLNSISTGMVRGHLWVIGGFSSTGKSAVLVNLVEDVLKKNGSAMVASTEMSQEQYMLRLLSVTSNVPQRVIRHGGMTVEQGVDYRTARDFYRSARIRVFDDLYNFTRIRRKAKQVKEEIGLDVLFVDFIQNINETGDEVKDARITAINLQALAKELDICVVALSQLSNSMAQQMNNEGLGNYYAFKGSGAIKDAADIAIMLDRDRENKPNLMWMHIVKNRHDQIGKMAAHFDLETGLLRQMTQEEMMDADPNAGRRSRRGAATTTASTSGNGEDWDAP